jgi:hypothetical protein
MRPYKKRDRSYQRNDAQITEIMERVRLGESYTFIAHELDLTKQRVSQIVLRERNGEPLFPDRSSRKRQHGMYWYSLGCRCDVCRTAAKAGRK